MVHAPSLVLEFLNYFNNILCKNKNNGRKKIKLYIYHLTYNKNIKIYLNIYKYFRFNKIHLTEVLYFAVGHCGI